MARPPVVALVLFALLGGVAAQQPNQFGLAWMSVNGVNGPPYPITGVGMPTGVTTSAVITGPPVSPFVLFGAPTLAPGAWTVLGNQTVDVDFDNGGFVLLDGTADPSINTAAGTTVVPYVVPLQAPVGSSVAVQALVGDATFAPYYARLTAATELNVVTGLVATTLTTPGNGGALFDFTSYGLTFPYYGSTYTRMFVNTDGNITFGSASGDFTPTQQEFQAQQPRIAPFWTDLAPGLIRVVVDASALTAAFPTVAVEWSGMVGYGATHQFRAILTMTTGDVSLVHAPTNPAAGMAALAGITPGQNLLPATGVFPAQRNLSALTLSPVFGVVNEAFWELFGTPAMPSYPAGLAANPFDLGGVTNTFVALGTSAAWYYAN